MHVHTFRPEVKTSNTCKDSRQQAAEKAPTKSVAWRAGAPVDGRN